MKNKGNDSSILMLLDVVSVAVYIFDYYKSGRSKTIAYFDFLNQIKASFSNILYML